MTTARPTGFINVTSQPGQLVSISRPAPGISLLQFLRHAQGEARFYWANEQGKAAYAGMGITAELIAWGSDHFQIIEDQARNLFQNLILPDTDEPAAGPRLFGGFAFRDDFIPDNTWSIYAPVYFVLPHYQLTQTDSGTWLTMNVQFPLDESVESMLPELREALDMRYEALKKSIHSLENDDEPLHPLEVNYPMPFEDWEQIINEAVDLIKAGELIKVVLSRVCEIRFRKQVNADAALAYLSRAYANSYRFLFEPQPYHAFFGAAPELLAKVEGKHLTTMGLAGSMRRGLNPQEDDEFAQQLLNDPKERHEHKLVADEIEKRLRPLTQNLHVPDAPSILQLSNIQHLYTPIDGELIEQKGILPIVRHLHPTPALGGAPREVAMEFIQQHEPVPRGWYAAPIGWIDHNLNGEFAVAIRSAVSQDKRVWLYAGAGIVEGSKPQKEWDETALKFRPMLDALGIRESVHV